MRRITPLAISPSEDLALVAQRFAHRMPRPLLFDSAYTRTLVDIGYRDADARIGEIEALISAEVDRQILGPPEEAHLLPPN